MILISFYLWTQFLIKYFVCILAVWAGWGHASENPKLPEVLSKNGIMFMGPNEHAMWLLGNILKVIFLNIDIVSTHTHMSRTHATPGIAVVLVVSRESSWSAMPYQFVI